MDTTMTEPRIDRGSTPTTSIYSIGGDLYFERTFEAPRDRVWRHSRTPRSCPAGGASGTTTVVEAMDVRPGGEWRYVSHADDREPVTFYGEYLEIDAPERFRWTFLFDVPGVGPQGGPEPTRSRTSAGGPMSDRWARWVRLGDRGRRRGRDDRGRPPALGPPRRPPRRRLTA